MTKHVFTNSWTSIMAWVNDIIEQVPELGFQLIDWETHGDTEELPNVNLIGPLALAVTEYDDGMYELVFSIGVSTYVEDKNLFKLREVIGRVFDMMQSSKRLTFYDDETAEVRSVLIMTPGTTVQPKTTISVRPFQYVQGRALLVPEGTRIE